MTTEDFKNCYIIFGRPLQQGEFFVESNNKIYSFIIGADGSVWKTNSNIGVPEARNNKNFIGIYE